MYNPNEKNENSKANKIVREWQIVDLIVNKLDASNKIKRYLTYKTKFPMASFSEDYNGVKVEQTDVDGSVIDRNIMYGLFYDEQLINYDSFIFVHCDSASYDEPRGLIEVKVDILISKKYNNLIYPYITRTTEIATEICGILDNYTIVSTDACFEDVGNITLELVETSMRRLSKSNDYTVYSMTFITNASTMRYVNE